MFRFTSFSLIKDDMTIELWVWLGVNGVLLLFVVLVFKLECVLFTSVYRVLAENKAAAW